MVTTGSDGCCKNRTSPNHNFHPPYKAKLFQGAKLSNSGWPWWKMTPITHLTAAASPQLLMSQLINKTCSIASKFSIPLLFCEVITGVWGTLTYWKLINRSPKSIQPIIEQQEETKGSKKRWADGIRRSNRSQNMAFAFDCEGHRRHIQRSSGFQLGSLRSYKPGLESPALKCSKNEWMWHLRTQLDGDCAGLGWWLDLVTSDFFQPS